MQTCRYCKEIIKDGDLFCQYCGYDPSTDMIHKGFVPHVTPPPKKSPFPSGGGVGEGVKKFAFIGICVLIFSIFYKNHFSISNVVAEVKHSVTMLLKGKFTLWKKPTPSKQETQWIDMRTFEVPEEKR